MYVALGSSFASGPGLDIADPSCSQASNNYPGLLADSLGLALTDVSCGGATVADVLGASPLGQGPQIDAVTSDAEIITVTVGGNDAQYLAQLIRSAFQHEPGPVETALTAVPDSIETLVRRALCEPLAVADRDASASALDRLPMSLAGMVEQIRARAGDARIVLVDYLTVVGPPGSVTDALPVLAEEAAYFSDLATRLEEATKTAARESGAELVEASAASRDHHVCSDEPWVFGFEFGDLLSGGAKAFHPNAPGMAAVADLVARHLAGPDSQASML
jgi:lysophospholipase L1-like esterase